MKRLVLAALYLCSAPAFVCSAPAFAQDDAESRAKVLFENGTTLYEEGDYQSAIVAFDEALRIFPAPAFHYNLANCYERLGDLPKAVAELNLYRAVAPESERDTLERRLKALETRIADAAPTAPAPAPAAAAPAAQPPPPLTVAHNHPRWSLVAIGASGLALGGAGAALTYSLSREDVDANDPDGYSSLRTWNGVGFGVGGVGTALALAGFVFPVHGHAEVAVTGMTNGVKIGGAW